MSIFNKMTVKAFEAIDSALDSLFSEQLIMIAKNLTLASINGKLSIENGSKDEFTLVHNKWVYKLSVKKIVKKKKTTFSILEVSDNGKLESKNLTAEEVADIFNSSTYIKKAMRPFRAQLNDLLKPEEVIKESSDGYYESVKRLI
jgi:hypothetical protein